MYRGSDSSVDIFLWFTLFPPNMFFHMCKQPVITWGRVWKAGTMCQHPSAPTLHRFAHRDLDEVLHCPGAKWHHAPAVLVVCGELLDSLYPARVCSSIGHWPSYHLAWDGQALSTIQLKNLTCMTFRAPWLHCAMFFLGDIWAHHSGFCHFDWGSNEWMNEWIHDSSAIKMRLRNALPFFLQCSRWVVTRKTHMALYSSFHVWNSLCTNSAFHRLLVKVS